MVVRQAADAYLYATHKLVHPASPLGEDFMRKILFIAALLPIAGCQSAAQRQVSDANFCRTIGAGQGPAYAQCMMQRDALNRQDQQARLARSAAMLSASAQIMAAPPQRPMTTTTCRRMGGQVVCNTF